jgi:hypothetical protein
MSSSYSIGARATLERMPVPPIITSTANAFPDLLMKLLELILDMSQSIEGLS